MSAVRVFVFPATRSQESGAALLRFAGKPTPPPARHAPAGNPSTRSKSRIAPGLNTVPPRRRLARRTNCREVFPGQNSDNPVRGGGALRRQLLKQSRNEFLAVEAP